MRIIKLSRSLMTAGLPLMKSALTPQAKNVLLSFGLSTGMSAEDSAIPVKIYGSGLSFAYNNINNFK